MHASPAKAPLSPLDRQLINRLQEGFPICDQPFQQVADELGMQEQEVINGVQSLLDRKILSRFGPMYHAERLGGGLTLAAMRISEDDFDRVAEQVNALPEVAHNYQRDHELNMWFVIATEQPEAIDAVIDAIQSTTGYPVYNMPKIEEFYVGLRFDV